MPETAGTLFYVEDDEALAFITGKALVRRGFTLAHFSSLEEANKASSKTEYSHALLDLKLEDGHSLGLITDLVNANPQIKIVVLTGYSSIATAVQAIKLGALNYLAKPASIEQILNAFAAEPEEENIPLDLDDISLKRLEWEKIQQVLAENDGNISATARQLKMHRRTLQRKLNKKPVSE